VFAPVYGPPFVRDLDGGRRYATIEDFRNFVKLAYMAPAMHHSGGTVCEPVDMRGQQAPSRHGLQPHQTLRQTVHGVGDPSRTRRRHGRMAKLLFGDDFVDQNCVTISLINANSPMVFDDTMLGALEVYARANQATIVSPFILAGAMSPVTAGRDADPDPRRSQRRHGVCAAGAAPAHRWCSARSQARSPCSPARPPLARPSQRWCSMALRSWPAA
jgi:trimethylamine:corrinoid methyltransferase-like protein